MLYEFLNLNDWIVFMLSHVQRTLYDIPSCVFFSLVPIFPMSKNSIFKFCFCKWHTLEHKLSSFTFFVLNFIRSIRFTNFPIRSILHHHAQSLKFIHKNSRLDLNSLAICMKSELYARNDLHREKCNATNQNDDDDWIERDNNVLLQLVVCIYGRWRATRGKKNEITRNRTFERNEPKKKKI